MANQFQSVRGFNDVLPADMPVWQHVHCCAREVVESYGYSEIVLPLLERTELFERSIGAATDVVEKEMFTFKDRENASLTLRPEFTAGMVRAGLEHGLLHNQQQRLWCSGPVFRHERPQAGRYRQFHQLNVEAYGLAGPDIDVEIIALSARLLKRLGLARAVKLELNSLGTPEVRTAYRSRLIEFLHGREAQLDENSRRRFAVNPMRALDSKDPGTRQAVADAPRLLDMLDDESRAHFQAVRDGLQALDIPFTVNPSIVRGLDYYTRTVFEWTTDQLGAQGTVLAGGRYDGLVQQLGGAPTSAIGWACGIERLILLIKAGGVAVPVSGAQVYFCTLGNATQEAALRLAEQLRDAQPGLRLILNAGGGKLAAQLKRADNTGAEYALVMGEQELSQRCVQLKSLRVDGAQETVAWNELAAALSQRLKMNS